LPKEIDMAENEEGTEQGSQKVEIDEDELKRLKASAADMSKWKKRAQKAEGDLGDLKGTVSDLEQKIEGLIKPRGEDEVDMRAKTQAAIDDALKKRDEEHKKKLSALQLRFDKERTADLALAKADVEPKYRKMAIRELDLDSVDLEELQNKVAEFVKDNPVFVTKQEPQPPTPPTAGPGGKAGSDGKPVTDVSQAARNFEKEMNEAGLSFEK
jgi:hypothetical protein